MLQEPKSRELAYSEGSGHSGQNGSEGSLGPPESVGKAEKHGKAGKAGKSVFLRVQGPLAKPVQGPVIGRGWAHSVPSPPSVMRGSLGSWSPKNVVAA